ncbi:polyisoprenoid-binding protein [Cytophagaceae bacterium 50C-KIRBA]|uniref:Polyisoprenoid-binding protein n=1 Tax=Aquirufa beregesia TaxID=2516556 RepID=A0ABX0EV99_9BACT|nr:YceI family protein [Aquirufa beregesia]NGZ43745.1 polyisoprenoid-binding protein [Aquirufa beregesia]
MANLTWALDPTHSEIQFKVKHLMITNVTGGFADFNVNAESSDESFADAKINFTAKAASITTGNEQRDAHLASADFFETDKFENISFSSTGIEKSSDDEFNLLGDLTIKDVTKPVKIHVEFGGVAKDPWGNVKAGFTINTKINRTDFGLNWNAALETGGVLVSEEIKIAGEIQLVKA